MTPKRGETEDRQDAVFTPRTVLLGELQPLTPTTTLAYSPFPTLDQHTKKIALQQVYQFMKGKTHLPVRKPIRNSVDKNQSRQLSFTPLELPENQESTSADDSEASRDEYFSDSEEF